MFVCTYLSVPTQGICMSSWTCDSIHSALTHHCDSSLGSHTWYFIYQRVDQGSS